MFRWLALLIFGAAISVSAYHRRRARDEREAISRSQESRWLVLGRALVAIPLFGGVLVYILQPSWMAWASVAVPIGVRWGGVGVGMLTVPGVHWVLRTLGRNISPTVLTKEEQELVRSGPYRWIRHPLYTIGIVLFGALGLIAANGFILSVAVLALVWIRTIVIPREERELMGRFGSAYERYMDSSGAMLPPIWSGW